MKMNTEIKIATVCCEMTRLKTPKRTVIFIKSQLT